MDSCHMLLSKANPNCHVVLQHPAYEHIPIPEDPTKHTSSLLLVCRAVCKGM